MTHKLIETTLLEQLVVALESITQDVRAVNASGSYGELLRKNITKSCKAITAGRAALAGAERVEPVAWMRPSEEGYDSAFRDHSTVVRCTGNPWAGWVPLYTTAPSQTTVNQLLFTTLTKAVQGAIADTLDDWHSRTQTGKQP